MSQTAHSIRELARLVKRSHVAVSDWVKHPMWDQARKPPWDVERAIAWAKRTLSPNPAAAWTQPAESSPPDDPSNGMDALRRQPLQAARLKLALVRAEKLAVEKAILCGDYVPLEKVKEAFIRRLFAVRTGLLDLPRRLAVECVDRTETEIEEIVDRHVRNLLHAYATQHGLPCVSFKERQECLELIQR